MTAAIFIREVQVTMQHQNVLGTSHRRTQMVKRVREEGVSVREVVAGQFGVSRSTVYKWLARYERGGQAKHHPYKLAAHLAVDAK